MEHGKDGILRRSLGVGMKLRRSVDSLGVPVWVIVRPAEGQVPSNKDKQDKKDENDEKDTRPDSPDSDPPDPVAPAYDEPWMIYRGKLIPPVPRFFRMTD